VALHERERLDAVGGAEHRVAGRLERRAHQLVELAPVLDRPAVLGVDGVERQPPAQRGDERRMPRAGVDDPTARIELGDQVGPVIRQRAIAALAALAVPHGADVHPLVSDDQREEHEGEDEGAAHRGAQADLGLHGDREGDAAQVERVERADGEGAREREAEARARPEDHGREGGREDQVVERGDHHAAGRDGDGAGGEPVRRAEQRAGAPPGAAAPDPEGKHRGNQRADSGGERGFPDPAEQL
jgi:hypothetical protein